MFSSNTLVVVGFVFYRILSFYFIAFLPYLSLLLALLLLLFTLSRPNLQPIFRLIFGPSSGPARTHYSIHFSVHSQADVGPKSGQNRQVPFSRPYPHAACFLFHLLVYCSSPVFAHMRDPPMRICYPPREATCSPMQSLPWPCSSLNPTSPACPLPP